jgi:hypothetical protein
MLISPVPSTQLLVFDLQEVMGEGEHRDVVAGLLSKISSLQGAAAAAEATRRALHNQMVELRGKVSVFDSLAG